MGTMIELTAADGHKLAAYRAEPSGKPRGGVIIVQEIFGVNKHIKRVTDGYAADGYVAVAPAYFDRVQRGVDMGYGPDDMTKGREFIPKMQWDQVMADSAAARDNMKSAGKVGIVGYCWGGTVAWVAAARLEGLAAAVSYYGGGVPGLVGEKPKAPVMFHFGETDQNPTIEAAKQVIAAHPGQQAHIYPAGHGFNCEERASFDEASSKLARERSIEFLRKHVG